MADRTVLFRTSDGAFQDLSSGDNLLAAGVKRAGTVTIDATAGNVVLVASADITLTASDDVSLLASDGIILNAGNITANATISNVSFAALMDIILNASGDITIMATDDVLVSSGDTLTLDAGTKIIFDSPTGSAYDAANERWGFGNVSPSVQWDFFSASPSATQGHMRVRTSTGTMFEVDLQNGLVTVGSSLVPAQLRTWATTIMAALRVGSVAGDPSTLANGDVWYDTSTGKFRARENNLNVDVIGGGGETSAQDIWRLSMLHQVAG